MYNEIKYLQHIDKETIMKKRVWETHNYTFSNNWFRVIIAYYIVLLSCGVTVSVLVMANISTFVVKNILLHSSFASMAVAAMLCSVQYLRRLYKACLEDRVHIIQSGEEIKQFGNVMYFILRPIYAIVFVLVAEFALLSGIMIIVPIDFQLNEKFLYFCVVVASIIGFSIGQILDKFEALSSKQVDSILRDKENN
jgi:hypothetical protein